MFQLKFINVILVLVVILAVFLACRPEVESESVDVDKDRFTFDTTYFDRATIMTLINQEGATGIRFYNAVKNRSDARVGALAVGIREDASEIYGSGTAGYFYGADRGDRPGENIVDRNRARELVLNVRERTSPDSILSAVFYKDRIFDLCRLNDCLAFKLVTATVELQNSDLEDSPSMALVSSDGTMGDEENSTSTSETQYYISSDPCPPLCPERNKLLAWSSELSDDE